MANRVLLVEDNELNSRLIQKVLESGGMEVIVLDSAEEALHQMESIRPDLILLDLQLPGMSGYEFVNQYTHQNGAKQIPIVAISANVRPEDKEKALEVGCAGFIEKPINTRTIVQDLTMYLE